MAKKKVTLETLDARFTKLEQLIERGFGAVANDLAEIRNTMATKNELIAVHEQVNAIERRLREMNYPKLEDRVAAIEQKVFGVVRA